METPISGIHRVTAIASNPQRNLDFYTEVLGLRLVKRTVNFDHPGTYYFYFADATGTPGRFSHFSLGRLRRVAHWIQPSQRDFVQCSRAINEVWESRLVQEGVPVEKAGKRLGEEPPPRLWDRSRQSRKTLRNRRIISTNARSVISGSKRGPSSRVKACSVGYSSVV
jgi:catechol 2,3-dioxygenase-like lactoylglutathione lyase family enzyme